MVEGLKVIGAVIGGLGLWVLFAACLMTYTTKAQQEGAPNRRPFSLCYNVAGEHKPIVPAPFLPGRLCCHS